ncbi:MAG: GNAT family N-acetyltransferase [Bacteriovorax sp.]|jgi:predicted GNAT superfamily acetyltransferase
MDYKIFYSMNPKLKKEIEEIYPQIFESFNSEKFFKKFDYHSEFLLLIAYDDGKAVGFKFGYGQDPDLFYSWTGGVLRGARRQGIAQRLMEMQHTWCKERGYKRIETRTRNKFPEMIALNVKFKFHIVGTITETDGTAKIILRKEI